MAAPPSLVILTGAGISAESGLPTFRTRGQETIWEYRDADGVLRGDRIEDVCTPYALARDPHRVLAFYDARRRALDAVAPNAAHHALARLDREWPGDLLIVTQNVDDLHERAGTRRLLHMHGALRAALCQGCGTRAPHRGDMIGGPPCAACGRDALRPDITFFGEVPQGMARIEAALAAADLFVAIGTSGAVYPAAGFVDMAEAWGVDTLELNLMPSASSARFARTCHGPAGRVVPAWVAQILRDR